MQHLRSIWTGMSQRQRLGLIVASIAVLAMLGIMSRIAARPSYALLYSGLEAAAAGDVLRNLDQRNIPYDVRKGAIYVDAARRDELRMILAGEGLPANGGRGYELLDSLNGFGTTSQMFEAAYWRAIEGELARTIVASPHIAQARVHIADGSDNPFQAQRKPSASVAITPAGGAISAAQAKALRHLVAAAIAGLVAEDVTVVDANGTLIGALNGDDTTPGSDPRAEMLRQRVQRLIEARVGSGNAVVEVSLDTVTETESIRERRFDPEERIAISTDTEERSNNSAGGEGGVTVASNLPDGDASANAGETQKSNESRTRINYEVSETEREILRTPGAIRRLTVAILVNGMAPPPGDENPAFIPRPDEELAALRALAEAAVGFDAVRGDVITIHSMQLPAMPLEGTENHTPLFSMAGIDLMRIIQLAITALVILILAVFVIRPLLARSQLAAPALPPMAALPPDGMGDLQNAPALSGEIEDGSAPLPALRAVEDDAVARLRGLIGERQEETVEILRSWLEEERTT